MMAFRALFVIVHCTLVIISSQASAQGRQEGEPAFYMSAVSPDFPDGLQAKFLQYLANELHTPIKIATVPFARRLRELQKGTLDLMVGVAQERSELSGLVLIEPAYESLETCLFVPLAHKDEYNKPDSLEGKVIAITRQARVRELVPELNNAKVIELESLQQKIDMLALGRIDGFFHIRQSTLQFIEQRRQSLAISPTPLVVPSSYNLHVAISRNGGLWPRRAELEKIVRKGVEQGAFKKIRASHYGLHSDPGESE